MNRILRLKASIARPREAMRHADELARPDARIWARRAFALGLLCAACSPKAPPEFELRSVIAPAIAALENEIAAEPQHSVETLEPDEVRQRVRALITTVEGAARDWTTMRGAVAQELGDAAIPYLVTMLSDFALPFPQRVAALQALSVLDTPAAAERLCTQMESSPEPWVRRHAAYELGTTSQDQCLPRLLARLRLETDNEARLWIASSLGTFGCLDGLSWLALAMANDTLGTLRANATTEIERLRGLFEAHDVGELTRGWNNGNVEGRLRARTPSARAKLDLWRRLSAGDRAEIADLALYPPWSVEILCTALHHADASLRSYALDVLERQGARAWTAQPVLVAALARPEMVVDVVRCLGAIRDPRSVGVLQARLSGDHPPTLRVEAARALGRLGVEPACAALQALAVPTNPAELVDTAWIAVFELGRVETSLAHVLAIAQRDPDFPRVLPALNAWFGALRGDASTLGAKILADLRVDSHVFDGSPLGTSTSGAVDERRRAGVRAVAEQLSHHTAELTR